MRTVYIVVLAFLTYAVSAETIEGKIIDVIDGNTFEVLTKEKEKITFMLFDVDSPEIGQEYGEEAKSFVTKVVLKKKVIIKTKGKDRWGNKLAQISLRNGDDLSEILVKSGLAWVGERYQSIASLKTLESTAKDNTLGMWQSEEIMSPWVYRRKQTMLRAKSR
ncbi:MAG: thermonuclease family protein [Bacteroidota bacterium]